MSYENMCIDPRYAGVQSLWSGMGGYGFTPAPDANDAQPVSRTSTDMFILLAEGDAPGNPPTYTPDWRALKRLEQIRNQKPAGSDNTGGKSDKPGKIKGKGNKGGQSRSVMIDAAPAIAAGGVLFLTGYIGYKVIRTIAAGAACGPAAPACMVVSAVLP